MSASKKASTKPTSKKSEKPSAAAAKTVKPSSTSSTVKGMAKSKGPVATPPSSKPVAPAKPSPSAPPKETKPVVLASRPARPKSTSAASILGRPLAVHSKGAASTWTPVAKIKPDWQKFYQNLLELHARLRDQMTGLAKESQAEMESYSLHMGDSGTDNFDRDFALSLLSSDQDALYEIEEALKRIEKGTYGVCELTGKSIPRARLDAIPWARFTVEAQAQLEKEGALKQRRLGALGTVETGSSVDSDDGDDEPEDRPASKEKE